jgi:pimeloyl-ACP methyl ester carboxylesterase
MHNPRLRRWLHRIDMPTHLLWGEQDGIVSTAYGKAWKEAIPGATMATIPHAGHYPHWEQPAEFVQSVRAFTERF